MAADGSIVLARPEPKPGASAQRKGPLPPARRPAPADHTDRSIHVIAEEGEEDVDRSTGDSDRSDDLERDGSGSLSDGLGTQESVVTLDTAMIHGLNSTDRGGAFQLSSALPGESAASRRAHGAARYREGVPSETTGGTLMASQSALRHPYAGAGQTAAALQAALASIGAPGVTSGYPYGAGFAGGAALVGAVDSTARSGGGARSFEAGVGATGNVRQRQQAAADKYISRQQSMRR
jgi:hypothetical protein